MASHNRIQWEGLDELRRQLRELPTDLRDEASAIVLEAGQAAEREIDQGYQRYQITGALRSGLTLFKSAATAFGVGVLLRNRAPHAWLFEHGSQTRKTGWYGSHNPMPARPLFIPIVRKHRARMYDALKGLLARAGLQVSGDA